MSPMQRNQGERTSKTPLISKIRSSRTSQGIFSVSGGGENQTAQQKTAMNDSTAPSRVFRRPEHVCRGEGVSKEEMMERVRE